MEGKLTNYLLFLNWNLLVSLQERDQETLSSTHYISYHHDHLLNRSFFVIASLRILELIPIIHLKCHFENNNSITYNRWPLVVCISKVFLLKKSDAFLLVPIRDLLALVLVDDVFPVESWWIYTCVTTNDLVI